MASKQFRQSFPAAGVSLERGTENVPDDGRFHLVVDGKVAESFRSEKQAQQRYQELRQAYLSEHPIEKVKPNFNEMMQRELETLTNKELLWTDEDHARIDRKTKRHPRA